MQSIVGVDPTTIRFVNLMAEPVNVFWIDYGGAEVFYDMLAAGASYDQGTFLTHPWLIRTVATNDPVVGFLPIDELAIANIAPIVAAVPEPSTVVLTTSGLLVAAGAAYRRRRVPD